MRSRRVVASTAEALPFPCNRRENLTQLVHVSSLKTSTVLLISMLAGWLVWTASLGCQEHNPPATTNSYIQHLEDPSRTAWQKPEEVVRVLNLKS